MIVLQIAIYLIAACAYDTRARGLFDTYFCLKMRKCVPLGHPASIQKDWAYGGKSCGLKALLFLASSIPAAR